MKILITGTSGFLGGALAAYLSRSHEIDAIGGREGFGEKLEARSGGFDWLLHAGYEVDFGAGGDSLARNLRSAHAVNRFCREGRAKRLLFLSGAAVMGVGKKAEERGEERYGLCDSGFSSYRNSSYVKSKIACEELFRAAGIPLTVLYSSTVYGPGMPESTRRSLQSRLCPPGGTSLIHLQDFLSAVEAALAYSENERFLVNAFNLPYRELLAAASGRDPIVLPGAARLLLPFLFWWKGRAVLESSFGYKYYSSRKLRESTGWAPLHTLNQCVLAGSENPA